MARKSVDEALKPYLQLLGKVPDQKIAEQAGVSRAVTVAYRNRLGIEPYDGHRKGRGKQDDVVVAAPTPAPVEAPKAAESDSGRSFRGRRSALDAYVHMLGKVADADIAKLAGVTPENVRTYRQRRGIDANWRGAETPAPRRGRPPGSGKAAKAAAAAAAATKAAPAAAPAPAAAKPAPAAPAAAPAPAAASSVGVAFEVVVETSAGNRSFVVVSADIAAAANAALDGVGRRVGGGTVLSVRRVGDLM